MWIDLNELLIKLCKCTALKRYIYKCFYFSNCEFVEHKVKLISIKFPDEFTNYVSSVFVFKLNYEYVSVK